MIIAPPGFLVQLSFSEFDLESNDNCPYDYLAIYDNIVEDGENVNPIGKYCGTEKPPVIMSTSRALTLVFKTDESVNGEGFLATYSFIDGRNSKSLFITISYHNNFLMNPFDSVWWSYKGIIWSNREYQIEP